MATPLATGTAAPAKDRTRGILEVPRNTRPGKERATLFLTASGKRCAPAFNASNATEEGLVTIFAPVLDKVFATLFAPTFLARALPPARETPPPI